MAAASWWVGEDYLHAVVAMATYSLRLLGIDIEVERAVAATPLDVGILVALLIATPCVPLGHRLWAGVLGGLMIVATDTALLAVSVCCAITDSGAGPVRVGSDIRSNVFAAVPSAMAVVFWLLMISRHARPERQADAGATMRGASRRMTSRTRKGRPGRTA